MNEKLEELDCVAGSKRDWACVDGMMVAVDENWELSRRKFAVQEADFTAFVEGFFW